MANTFRLPTSLKTILRGSPDEMAGLLVREDGIKSLQPLFTVIVLGCGCYGFSVGLWRSPLLAAYVAIKMPLLILATVMVNGLINGMLAQVLGSGLSFRQTLQACLMGFAVFSLIVGSLSPLFIGMVLDAPASDSADSRMWYRLFLLMHTLVIAFAGVVSNYRLLRLLQAFAGSVTTGFWTLVAWLVGNLFVGAQLSYTLRPFFGAPKLPVQFLREHPFKGNFYISVWEMFIAALGPHAHSVIFLLCTLLALLACLLGVLLLSKSPRHPFSP